MQCPRQDNDQHTLQVKRGPRFDPGLGLNRTFSINRLPFLGSRKLHRRQLRRRWRKHALLLIRSRRFIFLVSYNRRRGLGLITIKLGSPSSATELLRARGLGFYPRRVILLRLFRGFGCCALVLFLLPMDEQ